MAPLGRKYKVKLASGRVLGPLDVERISLLIRKNQILGTELARVHPEGEWQDINRIPELAALFISNIERKSGDQPPRFDIPTAPDAYVPATQILPGTAIQEEDSESREIPELKEITGAGGDATGARILHPDLDELAAEKTLVATRAHIQSSARSEAPADRVDLDDDDSKTELIRHDKKSRRGARRVEMAEGLQLGLPRAPSERKIAEEKTIMLTSGTGSLPARSRSGRLKTFARATAVAILLGLVGYELFVAEQNPVEIGTEQIRPKVPVAGPESDPQKSEAAYFEAVPFYVEDTVAGYKAAVQKLHLSASYQIDNVKALAMLASSYLNLIDSSNKDENYFNVLYKLIEMSRARGLDLPETVISDVEFFLTVNKPEVAQDRIVNYTRTHQNFGLELFYYLALTFFQRGDAQTAARYVSQIPDAKVFSPRVFYLRGLIAEKLGDGNLALAELDKAVAMNPRHAKSRLAIARIRHASGNIKFAADHLDYLVANKELLSAHDLALAHYLRSLLNQIFKRWDVALADAERAVKLDRSNHEYVLEYYSLRAKAGDEVETLRKEARMYFYLGEGQRLLGEGKNKEALSNFLLARQAREKSTVPLIAMGDMFLKQNDLTNARTSYARAAAMAPKDIDIWSKYIHVLIESFEWEEAQAAMDKFRKLPVPQSAIDKAAADIYAKQGNFEMALTLYRKAMTRNRIDPDVYLAYAETLVATKTKVGYDQAPFFYALALRFDPLNFKALIGTAKCIAATESIDRAITTLRDELQKSSTAHPQLLAAIAEFQIQKGDWEQAQENVSQAIAVNSEYAYSWLLQGRIHQNREGVDKNAIPQALEAFKAYSDRNPADPTGYLERYRIFMQRAEFDKAGAELIRIEDVYPKYPNLRYYKGARFSVMKNHKQAIHEFRAELKNNPRNVIAMIALGKELIESGDPQSALEPLSRAMQLVPRSAEAKLIAGYANYLLKNFAGAVALYQAAIALDPANSLIHKRLGMAYEAAGDNMAAAGAYRKYIQMEPDAPDRHQYERFR